MEDSVPGIKRVNKSYAKNTQFYKDLNKVFHDPTKSEGVLHQIGKQFLGVRGTKTGTIAKIKKLEKETGSDILNQLKKSLISSEFEYQGMGEFMDYLRMASGSGLGLTIGGFPGAVFGLGVSSATSVKGTKEIIKIGQKISKASNSKSGKIATDLIKRTAPISVTRD